MMIASSHATWLPAQKASAKSKVNSASTRSAVISREDRSPAGQSADCRENGPPDRRQAKCRWFPESARFRPARRSRRAENTVAKKVGEITERQPARGVQDHDFLPNGGDSLAINPAGARCSCLLIARYLCSSMMIFSEKFSFSPAPKTRSPGCPSMLWAFTGWLCGSRQRNDSPCILNSINHGVCDRIVIFITSLLTFARPPQPE